MPTSDIVQLIAATELDSASASEQHVASAEESWPVHLGGVLTQAELAQGADTVIYYIIM